jgi:D-aminopeptidase
MRARDFGIAIGTGRPGSLNAITDIPGVRVGHATLVRGDGPLRVGEGPVRTGVTVVFAHGGELSTEPVFAGWHRLNGNGELTGTAWIRESGMLTSAIGLTNTHSVGVVRDALVAAAARARPEGDPFWSLPVVGETWDGLLSDINGQHVTPADTDAALAAAAEGPVAEGSVGSGTGMICHGFKGGIGTASRLVETRGARYTIGVLVQANHGRRERFAVDGIPVGRLLGEEVVPTPKARDEAERRGSIIVVVATDAPLLPHQCERLAQRAGLGVARTGGVGEHWSGDLFLAFATGNRLEASDLGRTPAPVAQLRMLADAHVTRLFDAVVEATEESILNAVLAAETMVGRDGITAHGLDGDLLVAALSRYRWRRAS